MVAVEDYIGVQDSCFTFWAISNGGWETGLNGKPQKKLVTIGYFSTISHEELYYEVGTKRPVGGCGYVCVCVCVCVMCVFLFIFM